MSDKQHWTSLHRSNTSSGAQSLKEWITKGQEPTRSTTLGDVGDWFKSKLPNNRPERGGTLRDKGYWERKGNKTVQSPLDISTGNGDSIPPPTNSPIPDRQNLIGSHVQTRRSGTGGSDRLLGWNTPKNLSEAVPNSEPLPKTKGHSLLSTRHRWNELNSLGITKKRTKKMMDHDAEAKKEKGKSAASSVPLSAPAMEESPSLLEVLEAKRHAKKKAREERESLRESGDYLGVQGINPQTGVIDVTSDSGESTLSERTDRLLKQLKARIANAPSAAERKEVENEIIKIHLDHEVAKLRHRERAEKQLATAATGKWRRGTHQWSSVQEPFLSPIAQSQRSASLFSSQCSPYSKLYLLLTWSYNVGRQSHPNGEMLEQQELIDLSPPAEHLNPKQPSGTALSRETGSREASHSSDTVVKTPHRRSLANLSPGALELFENDISFHDPSELRLNGDLFSGPSVRPSSDVAEKQGGLSETKSPQIGDDAQVSGDALEEGKEQRPNSMSFLDSGQQKEEEPGGIRAVHGTADSQPLSDLAMTLSPSTLNPGSSSMVVKDLSDPQSQLKNALRGSFVQDLTTNHKKSITPHPTLEPVSRSCLEENQCLNTPESTYHQQIPMSGV
ncbi:hypothetical protein F66182_2861 [Fusarium sp. NRRL 66182]|nr:hypothetical protein F66182_2861 [Fusarium sp. NRRL 66182]